MEMIEVNISELTAGDNCYLNRTKKNNFPDLYLVDHDDQFIIHSKTHKQITLSAIRTVPTVYVSTKAYSHDELIKFLAKTFTWGPVVKIHSVGEFQIVEYSPEIFVNSRGTGKYDASNSGFSIYRNWKSEGISENSLDGALIQAIAKKHDGANSQAGHYFALMVKLNKGEN